jgi:hypothetical protein
LASETDEVVMSVSPQLVSVTLAQAWVARFETALRTQGWVFDSPTCKAAFAAALGCASWPAVEARRSDQHRLDDGLPLSVTLVKTWVKATQKWLKRTRPDVPLTACHAAWAQALGCSGWAAVEGHLKVLNAGRAERLQAAQTPGLNPTAPPVAAGDWVMEKDVEHPDLGRVKAVYWDDICHEWVMNVVLYGPDGERIGRKSPRLGGPAGFEPAVPFQYWDRITAPEFPMTRDRTGYRDWRGAAEVLPARNDARDRRTVLTDRAIETAGLMAHEERWFIHGVDVEAKVAELIALTLATLGEAEEDATAFDQERLRTAIESLEATDSGGLEEAPMWMAYDD